MPFDLDKIYSTYMETEGSMQEYQYDYYQDDKSVVPVYQRTSASPLKEKTHTNFHVNFFEDIIQRKTGYMSSNIKMTTSNEALAPYLLEFNNHTKQVTNNMDSISNASISGVSHRLVYTVDGIIKIKNIMGWQVVYDYDEDIYNPNAAYYYYTLISMEGKKVEHCDVYSRTEVVYYTKQKSSSNKNEWVMVGKPQLHNFNAVPIFPFMNNGDSKGDCEDTLDLMDNYDEIMSDTSGELKAARLAYLKIWGDLYTGQDARGNDIPLPDYLREFGTMLFGTDELGNSLGNAEFLEKNINIDATKYMLDILRTHIYEVSGSVDLKELTDNDAARVFAIQAAISRLENNANTTELYTRMALKKQYELLLYWIKEYDGKTFDVNDIEITFTRVFTKDKSGLATMLVSLMNVVSVQDAYALSELFDDPIAAAKRYKEEQGILEYDGDI